MIERLAFVELDEAVRIRIGLPGRFLELRRAWPRSREHLLLEYVDGRGRIIPGQWMADAARLRHVQEKTQQRRGSWPPLLIERLGVLLQPCGADRRLPGLATLLSRRSATLLSHRPERRAVVRLEGSSGERFAKVVPPNRVGEVAAAGCRLGDLAGRPFEVPRMLELDEREGVVIWSGLAGESLHELLASGRSVVAAARAVGAALRWMHDSSPPPPRAHDAVAEVEMLSEQIERLGAFDPSARRGLEGAASNVAQALAGEACAPVPIHRDFYDKQIFVDAGGRIGLLDFDTSALGEPALDVANMLEHLELRALQGLCSNELASSASEAFLDGYGPPISLTKRLGAYRAATRLRVACLYAYRPRWRRIHQQLVDRAALAPLAAGT